jgi:hypothetical protein
MTQSPANPRLRNSRASTLTSGMALAQSSASRRCTAPDCTTQLSRYNPDTACARHGGWVVDPAPRRRAGVPSNGTDAHVAV